MSSLDNRSTHFDLLKREAKKQYTQQAVNGKMVVKAYATKMLLKTRIMD